MPSERKTAEVMGWVKRADEWIVFWVLVLVAAVIFLIAAIGSQHTQNGPALGEQWSEWERVGVDVQRMAVPSGWLYKLPTGGYSDLVVFVPTPKGATNAE